jgi:phytoene synthase
MTDRVVTASREVIERGSKSFAAAARLFSPPIRERAYMLYAWCRHCDDQIDGQELGFEAATAIAVDPGRRLESLRVDTRRALAGDLPADPVFEAFRRVTRECAIPQRYPLELLAGFEMDVADHRYESLPDTLLYCYRVAGVVGVMMAYVMGVREPVALQRAADLGIAFQLTNIARDVLDDARLGRCYLPAAWLAEAGIPPGSHADEAWREQLLTVVQRLLAEADRYYASALQGLQSLPFRSAWAVATALRVYREIGDLLRERGARAWEQRAVVSARRKVWHACASAFRAAQAVTVDRWQRKQPRDDCLWADVDSADEVETVVR